MIASLKSDKDETVWETKVHVSSSVHQVELSKRNSTIVEADAFAGIFQYTSIKNAMPTLNKKPEKQVFIHRACANSAIERKTNASDKQQKQDDKWNSKNVHIPRCIFSSQPLPYSIEDFISVNWRSDSRRSCCHWKASIMIWGRAS